MDNVVISSPFRFNSQCDFHGRVPQVHYEQKLRAGDRLRIRCRRNPDTARLSGPCSVPKTRRRHLPTGERGARHPA